MMAFILMPPGCVMHSRCCVVAQQGSTALVNIFSRRGDTASMGEHLQFCYACMGSCRLAPAAGFKNSTMDEDLQIQHASAGTRDVS
jgi:hypothetical protein